jgi:hypothetical protein
MTTLTDRVAGVVEVSDMGLEAPGKADINRREMFFGGRFYQGWFAGIF